MARAAQAVINLAAIEHNFKLAQSLAPTAKAMAIVKADAYGHGAVAVAKKLEGTADAFGVACIEEAVELREAGIKAPVLLLEGFFSADELPLIAEMGFWTALHSVHQVEMIRDAKLAKPIHVWPKIDSGMHRLGLNAQEAVEVYHQLSAMACVEKIVMMSHMACADELDNPMSQQQIAFFDSAVSGLGVEHSLANSPSILSLENARRDWMRCGLMIYGATPFPQAHPVADKLKPAMSFTTEVIAIREVPEGECVGYAASFKCDKVRKIGTIAIGYADGYDRHIGNGSPILVNGQRTIVAGRVSMDMVTVDLTDIEGAQLGSLVELWGENLSVCEVAEAASTIPYTLFTGVSKRVPRKYINR
ncbi:MAG: alanine racemase [Pseudomonadales bacterium]